MSIKATGTGATPLYHACFNNLELVKLLLANGAQESINKADNYGNTPLYWACRKNNLDIVALLLKSGANVDKKSLNSAEKHPEILKLLKSKN
jgi:ankyrin repeat protein